MATSAPSALECPVCHEPFTVPKLLPCAHLVCRKCILSWLEKGGDQAGCPLCRAPISPASDKTSDDFVSLFDALPTDFATAALVESEKTLSCSSVCSCCEEAEGSIFCLQCFIKLCGSCAKTHAKIPVTRDHFTEKLSELTMEQLIYYQPVTCPTHSSRQAELYCASHEELMCVLCASSTHQMCTEVKMVDEVGKEKREELKVLTKKLEERNTTKINQLETLLSEGQAKFKVMRDKIKATFDDLHESLEAQRLKLNSAVKEREEAFASGIKSSKLDLENYEAILSAHKSTSERLVTSAPDYSLLGMMGKLKSRLSELESQALPDEPKVTTGELKLDSEATKKTKEAFATIGKLTDSSDPKKKTNAPRLFYGPEFAAVVKVGHRVRRGWDWDYGSEDGCPPGAGTVTELHPDKWVIVSWDLGGNDRYRMGADNAYDLRLVAKD